MRWTKNLERGTYQDLEQAAQEASQRRAAGDDDVVSAEDDVAPDGINVAITETMDMLEKSKR